MAVAAAFPSESRAKRGVYDFGGFGGHGAYAGYAGHGGFGGLGGLGAVVKGPSGECFIIAIEWATVPLSFYLAHFG